MAQKAKTAQPKSDPIIEALQRELKQQGFYAGEIDGQAGAKTTEAVARRDAKQQADKRLEIELLTAQGNKGKTDAEAAATAAQTARKTRYDEQAASPLGMTSQSAASIVAPAVAGAAGLGFGDKVNRWMDKGQENRNATLRGAADDRVRGLTTREGAVTGSRLAGAMPPSNSVMRVGGRMAPHAALAALSVGKGAQLLGDVDEDQEFYPRMADRAAGLGYLGFGGGILKRGIQQAQSPGVSPDAQALSVINSSQLRRNAGGAQSPLARALTAETIDVVPEQVRPALPAPDASEAPKTATPGTKAHMQAQAKDLGIKGTSRMTKSQLAEALSKTMSEHGAKRTVAKRVPKLPGGTGAAALAGGLAYALTPDRAEAAGGAPAGAQTEALTNAGIAGGTALGVSKLAEALGPAAGRALGTGLNVAGAGLSAYDNASEAQGYRDAQPPEQQASPFGQLMPHAMPLAMRGAQDINSITSAPGRLSAMLGRELSTRDLPQSDTEVAQPGFMGPDAIPAGAPPPPPDPGYGSAGPLMSAAALELPQGIPPDAAAQADIASGMEAQQEQSPFPPQIDGRLRRMISGGASPQQIASFLNSAYQ